MQSHVQSASCWSLTCFSSLSCCRLLSCRSLPASAAWTTGRTLVIPSTHCWTHSEPRTLMTFGPWEASSLLKADSSVARVWRGNEGSFEWTAVIISALVCVDAGKVKVSLCTLDQLSHWEPVKQWWRVEPSSFQTKWGIRTTKPWALDTRWRQTLHQLFRKGKKNN